MARKNSRLAAIDGANTYKTEDAEKILVELDDCYSQLDSLKSKHMAACKPVRQDMAALFEQAKDAGIPGKAFKTLVKNRQLQRKIGGNVARLEADDAESYERLVVDLGDFINLPLGEAAARRAREGMPAGLA